MGTFYAGKLKFWYATHPDLSLQLYARFAPTLCPWLGLGVKMYANMYKCLSLHSSLH